MEPAAGGPHVGGTVVVSGTLTHAPSAGTGVFGAFQITSSGVVNGNGASPAAKPDFIVAFGNLTIDPGGVWTTGGSGPMRLTFESGSTGTLNGNVTGTSDLTVNGIVTASANIAMASIANLQIGGSLTLSSAILTTPRGNGEFRRPDQFWRQPRPGWLVHMERRDRGRCSWRGPERRHARNEPIFGSPWRRVPASRLWRDATYRFGRRYREQHDHR